MRYNLNNLRVSIALWLLKQCHYKAESNNIRHHTYVTSLSKQIDCI